MAALMLLYWHPLEQTVIVSAAATEVMIRQVTAKQMHFIDLSPHSSTEAMPPTSVP
jgi:hypothetical protein